MQRKQQVPKFSNNAFMRRKVVSSIDGSSDGTKFEIESSKYTNDEIIIIK